MVFSRLNAAERENVTIQRGYGLQGHPSVAILDAKGNVVERYFGGQSAETLRLVIEKVLAEN